MYCTCQAKGSRGPAAATALQLRQEALCIAPATQKGSAEALCTAPARQKAAAGQRRPPRRSSARKLCVLRRHATQKGSAEAEVRTLCVLRLPGKRQPRASGGHRAAAPPESSMHALRLPRKGKCGGSVYPPRRSSSRKLYVLRLPRTREVRRLCVLRLPGKRQPRASGGHRAAAPPESSMYCACHAKGKCGGTVYYACQAKGSRGPAAATAPQLRQEALRTAPATQKGSAEALCTAPARQKAAAGQRRPPRRSSARKLCVLRLPRKREVRRLKAGSSVYCACHAKGSQEAIWTVSE